jgi:O-antigen ligase
MSIGIILLLIFWFFNPGVKNGISRLTFNNPATWMAGLFALHLIWLVNTSDWAYAAKDLRIKLPLLVLALALGTIKLSRTDLKKVFVALGIGIFIATMVGYYLYFSDPMVKMDPRSMAPDISHIRLSLMIVVFIGGCLEFFCEVDAKWKLFSIISVLNALVFLYFLQTLTVLFVLFGGLGILLIRQVIIRSGKGVRIIVFASVVAIPVFLAFAMKSYYSSYFELADDALPIMDKTDEGNGYNHYDTLQIENGNYLYANISEHEMVDAWNERSEVKIDFDPKETNALFDRLLRYLTSKGLAKDKRGVESLSSQDIANIEAGFPAVAYVEKSGLELRIHTFLHGTHLYLTKGILQGSSFYQRFVYWQIGYSLARENLVTGVGTGDVKQSFNDAYVDFPIFIESKYRHRAHNQYITFLVTFGVLGFIYFLAFLGVLIYRWRNQRLFLFFAIVALVSFLSEDTLETQAGVTFFSFFVGLFSAASSAD